MVLARSWFVSCVFVFLNVTSSAEEHDAATLHQKGVEMFFAGKIKEAVSHWDREIALDPRRGPHHWQRGLALYYAGEYEKGIAQFESHQTVNGQDVENAAWHFLCVARAKGGSVEKARENLIPIQGDARVPMKEIHQLFSGLGSSDQVWKACQTRSHFCYGYLYLGLYYEALGKREQAALCMKKAAIDFKMDHYMGRVAQLHHRLGENQQFQNDVNLLGDGIVLEKGRGRVLVSPRFQGAVLVSTFDGESLGWINRDAIRAGKGGVGGADRFWFGPDGSQFTVFFEPGKPLEEKNWRVPPEIASGEMKVLKKSEAEVIMEREIRVQNHLGTKFHVRLKRTVTVLPPGNEAVAFRVENQITNLGAPWKAESGLLSIWSLGSFSGNDSTEVSLPLYKGAPKVRRYFEPFQKDQLIERAGLVRFRCNGNWRSKIGLPPEEATGVMSSYDTSRQLYTVIKYQVGKGTRFPHAERGPQKKPYAGDLVNVYNHGSLDRKPFNQPQFYEMESASPMLELKTGESITHWQEVYHYRRDRKALIRKIR